MRGLSVVVLATGLSLMLPASAAALDGDLAIIKRILPSPVKPIIPDENPLHHAINHDQAIFMPFLSTGNLRIAEACTLPNDNHIGASGLWIETEHSPLTLREVEDLVIFCHAHGLAPVVRVRKNDVDQIKQILDLGALGVVIPQIRTAEDAAYAVHSCLYPPDGTRPAGVGRASGYFTKFKEYQSRANSLMCVILMIETKDAVENIDAICSKLASNKDMLWIGPYDLAQDMGVVQGSSKHMQALLTIEQAAAKHGISLGGNADTLDQADKMFQRGYRAFTYGRPPEMQLAGAAQQFFGK